MRRMSVQAENNSLLMEDVEASQKRERRKITDCLSCRVIGTVVPLAASGYLLAFKYSRKPPQGLHSIFTLAFAGGFAALGVTRALI